MKRRSKSRQHRTRPTFGPKSSQLPNEERQSTADASRREAETAREDAERGRALAEESRELAEEIRRGAESLRVQQASSGRTAEHGRRILEAALRAESRFQQRFDLLVDGITEMSVELKRLRHDAAELRKLLSDMQQAAQEERLIGAERQATQQRMDRERFRERR